MVKKTTASTFISDTKGADEVLNSTGFIQDLNIELIDSDEENEYLFGYNEVDEIAKSIDEIGFKSVVTVYKKDNGRYQCLSGNSRIKACIKNGIKTIRAEIVDRPKDNDEKDLTLIKLNKQRVNRPLYMARQIQREEEIYRKRGLKGSELEEKLCDSFHIKRTQLFTLKRINSLNPILQDLCAVPGVPYTSITKLADEIPEEKLKAFHDKVIEECENNDFIDGATLGLIFKSIKEKEAEENNEKHYLSKKIDVKKVLKKLDKIDVDQEIKIRKKDREEIKEKALLYIEYLNKVVDACER